LFKEENMTKCNECEKEFINWEDFKEHLNKVHNCMIVTREPLVLIVSQSLFPMGALLESGKQQKNLLRRSKLYKKVGQKESLPMRLSAKKVDKALLK
jgi:hypothetical protein